ncbi:hypothetical protein QJQ45_020045 [Haematococcus lacustris]|nr:hypothetical protein QJQ45_020045 [Haematococcus lacustris]
MSARGDDLVLQEGDEEVQYITLELPANVPEEWLKPGAALTLQGLDTDYPTLKFPQGTVLKGIYGPTLGTTMVFATTPGQGSQEEASMPPGASFVGLAESKLVFTQAMGPQVDTAPAQAILEARFCDQCEPVVARWSDAACPCRASAMATTSPSKQCCDVRVGARFCARHAGVPSYMTHCSVPAEPHIVRCDEWLAHSAQGTQQLLADLSKPPRSLQYDGRPPPIREEIRQSFLGRMALKLLLYDNKWNQLVVGGQVLYDAIKEQVDDGALHEAFGMDAGVFYSTYTLLSVHVWLVINRMSHRTDKEAQFFRQRFYNHFNTDVEKRIYAAGVQVGVSKWARKLENIFYSSSLSFDQVLRREGTETMEGVVLREFFGNDTANIVQARLLAKYLTHELYCMQLTDESAVMQGRVQFSREPFAAIRALRSPP